MHRLWRQQVQLLGSCLSLCNGSTVSRQRDAGNDLRYEQNMKDGLPPTDANTIIADADLTIRMRELQWDASLLLSTINGVPSIAHEPALHVAYYNDNGEIESKQVERERGI